MAANGKFMGALNGRFAVLVGGRRRLYAAKAEYVEVSTSQFIGDPTDAGGHEIPGGVQRREIRVTEGEMSLLSLEEDLGITTWDDTSDRYERKNYVVAAGTFTLTDPPSQAGAVAFVGQLHDDEPLQPLHEDTAIHDVGSYVVDYVTGIVTVHTDWNTRIIQAISFPADAASGYSSILPVDYIPDACDGWLMQHIEGGFGSRRGTKVMYFPKLMRKGMEHHEASNPHEKGTDNERVWNVQAGYPPEVNIFWE